MRAAVETLRTLRGQADELAGAIALVEERPRRVELIVALLDVRAALKDATSRLCAFDLPALNQRAWIVAKQLDVLAGSVVVVNDDQK